MSLRSVVTTFTTPRARIAGQKTVSKVAVNHGAKATILGGALTMKTNFTGTNRLTTAPFQKRFYAGGSVRYAQSNNVFTPPENPYKKDLKNYDDEASRNSTYLLVGTYSMVGAMAAKNIVSDFLVNLSASADVLAMSKLEVNLATIPEGKNVVMKWRGKPIFVRHRTADEIDEANAVSMEELRHKETDSERVKKPEWLVLIGVCTHLGCVPVGEGSKL
jgi:ubiquinol-cytochrome c reductase iron-sulfur subunit